MLQKTRHREWRERNVFFMSQNNAGKSAFVDHFSDTCVADTRQVLLAHHSQHSLLIHSPPGKEHPGFGAFPNSSDDDAPSQGVFTIFSGRTDISEDCCLTSPSPPPPHQTVLKDTRSASFLSSVGPIVLLVNI